MNLWWDPCPLLRCVRPQYVFKKGQKLEKSSILWVRTGKRMEVRRSCPCPEASSHLMCEGENTTFTLKHQWENSVFLWIPFHFYSALLGYSFFQYFGPRLLLDTWAQAVMQSALQMENICPQWQNRGGSW